MTNRKRKYTVSLLIIFSVIMLFSSCDSSISKDSSNIVERLSFDMPEALQGTWCIHPDDKAKYPEFVQKMTITEDDMLWYYNGKAVSLKETWSPSTTTPYPYLDYEFFEEIGEYRYKFGVAMYNTKEDPVFVTTGWYAFEVSPRMPNMMIMYSISYNDEYGWTDGSFIVRYVLEGTTPPVIY